MVQTQQRTEQALLRRYLLGEVNSDERPIIEQRLLTDQRYFLDLLRVEEELTDEYARGELAPQEEQEFTHYFLNNPERRENVEFARSLNKYLLAQTVPEQALDSRRHQHPAPLWFPRWWRVAEIGALCAVLLLGGISAWLYRETIHLKEQLHAQRSASEQRERDLREQAGLLATQSGRLEQEMAKLKEQAKPPGPGGRHADGSEMVSVVLMPGIIRNAHQTAIANLSPTTRRVRLELELTEGSYSSYRAELQTVEGEVVWSRNGLRASDAGEGNRVVVVLPATLIRRSDYLIMLNGTTLSGPSEKAGTYYFKIVRK
ncbi:MAG TPA: hypothetical protein VG488_09540 [Candidatus Angelobacter sp.]|jgi:cell division protein FtsB|nr:hypothetical protein [Candidatus Angelobacter sp.]